MRHVKNKKKLSVLALAFLLTFVVGTAFAFSSGMLDVVGNVYIHAPADYVLWTDVEVGIDGGLGDGGLVSPFGASFNAIQQAEIVIRPGGLDDQRIEWEVAFYQDGYAELTGTVSNMHPSMDAEISRFEFILDQDDADDFGLTLGWSAFTQDTLAVGTIIGAGDSMMLTFELAWDGTIPDGFTSPSDEYALATIIGVEFDYDPI